MTEAVSMIIGFVLTLCVFSYLLGDNPLYRLAVHLLMGVTAAYASLLVFQRVILPVFQGLADGTPESALWILPIVAGIFLLLKLTPRLAAMGNWAMALLIGVGGAVALVGAISGTLLPQITRGQGGITGFLSAILTIFVLSYFQFTRPERAGGQDGWQEMPAWLLASRSLGRGILMITFGAIFAAAINTSLILFVDRLNYFVTGFSSLLP
jgi:hypothetical protein